MKTQGPAAARLIAGLMLGCSLSASPADPLLKPVAALCYGPFREGQAPGGTYPTPAEMEEDLTILRNVAYAVRTYGTEAGLASIPRLCNQDHIPLDCYPGAWIDNAPGDDPQVAGLIEIARQEYGSVKGLIVGSEFLLREEQRGHSLTPAIGILLGYIGQVKAITGLPVTVAEPWHIWNYDAVVDLADAADFIMIHVHPYWESPYWTPPISIETAVRHVIDRYDQIRAKYPGKRVVIGETGWPTAGPPLGGAVPGHANQERFLRGFTEAAHARGIEYFWFAAFDEPWKGEGGVGPHWGILDKDREIKPGLRSIVRDRTRIRAMRPGRITVGTYELGLYCLEAAGGLAEPEWECLMDFQGAAGVDNTLVPLPPTSADAMFYRVGTRWH